MFTIQYTDVTGASRMQTLDGSSRTKLVRYLASFRHPILAVYEQATPITKAVREQLAAWPGSKSVSAQKFVNSPS